jgi:uncharacterized phage infection (PIP) family protein YhgE
MNTGSRWAGWVSFASIVMMVVGALDAIAGLVAILQRHYYVQSGPQVIVFDVKTWGWLTVLWGIVLGFAGYSLLRSEPWARWFTIVAGMVALFLQLGFLGSSDYPLISLVILALIAIVLYVLLARWDEVKDEGF